ncbi:hypothetical protein ACFL29_00180 [Patescibacteria group bacterium]
MNYIKPLLTLQFWFDLTPPPLLPVFYWFFLIVFLVFIVTAMVCGRIYNKEKDKFILRFSAKYLKSWFLSSGLVGLVLLAFNYERATLLAARFWFLLWLIGFGVWLYFIIRKIRRLPQREVELKKQAQFDKYLPKSKNHKSK